MREMDENGLLCAKYQASIFEGSIERFSCSSKVFLRRFVNSSFTFDVLDKNENWQISFREEDCYEAIEKEYGISGYGKEKYSAERLYWLGYLTRCLCYMLGITTKMANKYFPFTEIISHYEAYHTQSVEWCVMTLMEQKGLKESDFDPYLRFKKAYLPRLKNAKEST